VSPFQCAGNVITSDHCLYCHRSVHDQISKSLVLIQLTRGQLKSIATCDNQRRKDTRGIAIREQLAVPDNSSCTEG
jgi:hypothetical protein